MSEHPKKKRFISTLGTFRTQAISQASEHQEQTNVAMPDDDNVKKARDWIIENKK